jgi:hypothetical protein
VKPATFSAFTLASKMFLLLRKGQFGEKLERKVEIFLIPVLKFLQVQKTISYHLEK